MARGRVTTGDGESWCYCCDKSLPRDQTTVGAWVLCSDCAQSQATNREQTISAVAQVIATCSRQLWRAAQ